MSQRKWKKILFSCIIVFLLVFSFWYGGNSDGLHGFSVSDQNIEESVEITETDESSNGDIVQGKSEILQEQETSEENNIFQQIIMHIKKKDTANTSKNTQNNKKAQKNATKAAKKSNSKKKKQTASTAGKKTVSNNSNQPGNNTNTQPDNSPDSATQPGNQVTENPANTDSGSNEANNTTEVVVPDEPISTENAKSDTITCTVYISCATLLDHMDSIKSESKKKLVPKDGVILETTSVTIKEGSTVFDVLKNVTKAEKIHLEYSFTPMFKSYYIEGIYNLYEFDGGDLSGWMYNVNGEFPAYGCSEYIVKDGDEIKWLYTCDLGRDVGCYFLE